MADKKEEYSHIISRQHEYVLVKSSVKDILNKTQKTIGKNNASSTRSGVLHQIFVTGSVLILAAACGMPIGYSAILLPQLYNSTDPLSMDIELGSWFASVHSLATPLGAFASGPISDKFGRKTALLATILPLTGGWILIATATSHIVLLAGRIIAGIGVGLTGPPAQVLLGEISEPKLRGLLVGVPFVAYSLGILMVYALGSELHWRVVAWYAIILPILSGLLLLIFSPESPTWLVKNGYLEKASNAMTWLRGDDLFAKRELNKLIERIEQDNNNKINNGFLSSIFKRSALKPLFIINFFSFLQVFSGTFLVVFYAVDIIADFGGNINTMSAALMTAIVRLLCSIIFCFFLLSINRRTLIIFSGLGSGISSILLGLYMYINVGKPKTMIDMYISGTLILFYIACNTGFLVMPGIMIGELLPVKIRGQAAGYIFAIINIIVFGTAKIFPLIQIILKTYGLFIMFGLSSITGTIVLFLMLPETKGRTLGQIEDYFENESWLWIRRRKNKLRQKLPQQDIS